MYGRESDSDESEVSPSELQNLVQLFNTFWTQEGPDFDNPSFYPKPQQQQQSAGDFSLSLPLDRRLISGSEYLVIFFRPPWKWKLVLAPEQTLVKMEMLHKLACMSMLLAQDWLPIKHADFKVYPCDSQHLRAWRTWSYNSRLWEDS